MNKIVQVGAGLLPAPKHRKLATHGCKNKHKRPYMHHSKHRIEEEEELSNYPPRMASSQSLSVSLVLSLFSSQKWFLSAPEVVNEPP